MSLSKEEILSDNGAGGYVTDNRYRQLFGHRENLYKAMDEYAKQEAIEFFLDTTGGYMFKDNAEQLYQQYLSSKTK